MFSIFREHIIIDDDDDTRKTYKNHFSNSFKNFSTIYFSHSMWTEHFCGLNFIGKINSVSFRNRLEFNLNLLRILWTFFRIWLFIVSSKMFTAQMCAKFLWLSLVIKHWNDPRMIFTSLFNLKQSGGIDAPTIQQWTLPIAKDDDDKNDTVHNECWREEGREWEKL